MLKYKVIEIFTDEAAHFRGRSLAEAVVRHVAGLKIAARCMVTRGIDGCYESGEIATSAIEILSFNMPVSIRIVLPESEFHDVLGAVEKMVEEGIVAVRDLGVVAHKTRNRLIPRHIRVRDAMTPNPRTVKPETPMGDVVRLLLSSVFTGVLVVDDGNRPVGVVSLGDCVTRGGLPLTFGLLQESEGAHGCILPDSITGKTAEEIMSRPAVAVSEQAFLTEAVRIMLKRGVSRLPAVDGAGKLTGILSRSDLFRAFMAESPDWNAFIRQHISVGELRRVADVMRRETLVVSPDASVEEVIRVIDRDDLRSAVVTDREGRFLGVIRDGDLLPLFSDPGSGFREFLSGLLHTGRKRGDRPDRFSMRTASEAMDADAPTVREDASLEEAVRVMVERGAKRLPVLDASGTYKGMITRESLLRAEFPDC